MSQQDHLFEPLEARQLLAALTVSNTNDSGVGSLRQAVLVANAAPDADTITFVPALNGRTITLTTGALAITNPVVIAGPGANRLTVSGNNTTHPVFTFGPGASSLSGLSITGGGGGVTNNGTLAITSSTISGNAGNGISNGGSLVIAGSTISDNLGIGISGGSIATTNTTITGNLGGGIRTSRATLTITSSTISGNSGAGDGGGIYCPDGTLTITDSTISDNTASHNGGGIYSYFTSLTITNSTVSGNTASGSGGGIYSFVYEFRTSIQTITNSTIAGNTATVAGGIFYDARFNAFQLLISNSTIAGNRAGTFRGGGIKMGIGTLTAIGTIVAGNVGGEISGSFAADSANNLIQNAASAGGLVNGVNGNLVGVDPLIEALADNGGPTPTMALLADSPAIDAGLDPNNLSTDQRGTGFPRVRGDGPDIGAFEYKFNAAPNLDALTSSDVSLTQGNSLTLTARDATDADGTIARVDFYRDSNNNGIADAAELLGTDSNSEGGYTYTLTGDQSNALPTRSVTFLAIATDNDGANSAAVHASATVLFSTRAGAARAASGSADSSNTHRAVSVNPNGHVIVFQAGWTVADLQALTGAPNAVSDAAIWVDPKDDLTYVAAPSNDGLILFTRASDGTWSFRNLSTETSATSSPTNRLVHFISKDRIVVVAGFDANGNIVAFRQTGQNNSNGAPEFGFVDISGQLTGQAMATPNYSSLTTFVTNWNTWHLVGIDTGGQIQSVWIDVASFSLWRVDNLSAQYGAPPVQGQLAVTLTSWGGINLTGLDTSGHLRVTWWVPGSIWENADLTTSANGASFTGGSITGYGTPWGGMNYIGLDSDGQVVGYWWAPDNDRWFSGRFLPENVPASSLPSRTLTSYSSDAGTLNIFGVASDNDAVRMWWQPGAEAWTVENLTEVAART